MITFCLSLTVHCLEQQFEELDNKVSKLSNLRGQSFDDFNDTNMAFRKNVRKCRELKDTLSASIEKVERNFKQINIKQRALEESKCE